MKPSPRLADFLPYLLSVTSNTVSAQIAEKYHARFGLKITDWRVLAVLGDSGPHTQRELVELTQMDKVAVNRACKTVAERGLVKRKPNADDGRSHRLELTDDGRDVFAEIMPLALQMEEAVFAELSDEEKAMLRNLLRRVYARASEM